MPRVLVERPRGGWRRPFGERRRVFERKCRSRDGEEALPTRMRMGFAPTKWLSENLGPLRRFLMSRRELLPQGTLSGESWLRGFFYVCCDTALLRWVPPRRRKKRRAPEA